MAPDQVVETVEGWTTYQIVGSIPNRPDGFYTFAMCLNTDSDLERFLIAFGALDLLGMEYGVRLHPFTFQVIDIQSPARIAESEEDIDTLDWMHSVRRLCLQQGTRMYLSFIMANVGQKMGMRLIGGREFGPK